MSPPESRWVWQLVPGPDESFGLFPPAQPHLQTQLCPACYAEPPVHRVTLVNDRL